MSSKELSSSAANKKDIRKMGYLKKLKTMKKKFFVLRADSEEGPARLEYYDSEKKWRSGHLPKRVINLKTCFDINRKLDSKQRFVIALYTKDDCFAVALDSESELEQWLLVLLQLQRGEESLDTDDPPKSFFEHVWEVNVKNKGLGSSKNILGQYRLCLTSTTLSLVRMNADDADVFEFPLVSIRRCGHSDCFFFMEVGRSTITGAGELWMQTEDTLIAQNMHEAILNAMKASRNKEEFGPKTRSRSSSATETSKPISVQGRRQVQQVVAMPAPHIYTMNRERSDSFPSRARTTSEKESSQRPNALPHDTHRPRSVYYSRTVSGSPPVGTPLSPTSALYSTDSAGSSQSIDDCDSSHEHLAGRYSLSAPIDNCMPHEPPIEEEVPYFDSYMPMAPGEECSHHPDDPSSEAYMDMNPNSSSLSYSLSPPNLGSNLSSIGTRPRLPSATTAPTWISLNTGTSKSGSPPRNTSVATDYIEMMSPDSHSPGEASDGYIAMSPVRQMPPPSPDDHDRDRDRTLSTPDSYVPMAPISGNLSGRPNQEDEGYMDMTPLSRSLVDNSSESGAYMDMMVSRKSLFTSGTPSTDIRFSEFQLEKVCSYFTPAEGESEGSAIEEERIVRAYSVGSRPSSSTTRRGNNSHGAVNSNLLDVTNDGNRIRAFSVGSKGGVKFGSRLGANRAPRSTPTDEDNPNSSRKCEQKTGKSNSAPILGTSPISGTWSGPSSSTFLAQRTASQQTGRSEDLMELDFPETPKGAAAMPQAQQQPPASFEGHRRSSASSSSRPRANSRSRSSAVKVESLQVIGERGDRGSVSVEDYAEMGGASGAVPLSKSEDYMDMRATGHGNAQHGHAQHSRTLSADDNVVEKKQQRERKTSLPIRIHGLSLPGVSTTASAKPPVASKTSPPCGDYVNIDRDHGQVGVAVATANLALTSTPRLSPKPNKDTETAPEYVNLQFGSSSRHGSTPPIPIVLPGSSNSNGHNVVTARTNGCGGTGTGTSTDTDTSVSTLSSAAGSPALTWTPPGTCHLLPAHAHSSCSDYVPMAPVTPEELVDATGKTAVMASCSSGSSLATSSSSASLVSLRIVDRNAQGPVVEMGVEDDTANIVYADLDLPQSSSEGVAPRVGENVFGGEAVLVSGADQPGARLTYAKIDFMRLKGVQPSGVQQPSATSPSSASSSAVWERNA